MTTQQQLKALAPEDKRELATFVEKHGSRVRRAEAMTLLDIHRSDVFKKFVDANPEIKHQLEGERQAKYLTEVIWLHQPSATRRATRRMGKES